MALYDSVKMMGIWVTTFLLAWLQVKKNSGWEEHAVRVKLHNVLAAKLSQEAELTAFPQPLILTLVQEFTAQEFPFMPIPWGVVMIWVRPLLWSGLKIALPNPTPPPKPADCVFAPRDSWFLWHSAVHGQSRKLCRVPLSQALKWACDWQGTEFKPCRSNHSHAAEFLKSTSHLNTSNGNPWLVLQ